MIVTVVATVVATVVETAVVTVVVIAVIGVTVAAMIADRAALLRAVTGGRQVLDAALGTTPPARMIVVTATTTVTAATRVIALVALIGERFPAIRYTSLQYLLIFDSSASANETGTLRTIVIAMIVTVARTALMAMTGRVLWVCYLPLKLSRHTPNFFPLQPSIVPIDLAMTTSTLPSRRCDFDLVSLGFGREGHLGLGLAEIPVEAGGSTSSSLRGLFPPSWSPDVGWPFRLPNSPF